MTIEEKIYNYVLNNCKCQYIKHEKAYSAFITLFCYDWQEFGESEQGAKENLASVSSKSMYFKTKWDELKNRNNE